MKSPSKAPVHSDIVFITTPFEVNPDGRAGTLKACVVVVKRAALLERRHDADHGHRAKKGLREDEAQTQARLLALTGVLEMGKAHLTHGQGLLS